MRTEDIMRTVVVGVDGSEHGDVALAFAAEEAALRGAVLRIVCAWRLPSNMTMDLGLVPGLFESFRGESEAIVADALAKVEELRPGLVCEAKAVEGHAGTVILEEAHDADMVVVGSRGRGELAGRMLGSISQHIINHSPCPVAVVPIRH
ncbi:MAG: universal stress protein [Thermoleophilia bacterium]|jgi:nucleotide-binding universal stress UspA family protein